MKGNELQLGRLCCGEGFYIHALGAQSLWPLPPGMTVEVLGTVLGTAIQGQIVGKVITPCIESPLFIGKTNSSVAMEELNMTHDTGSLTDTVSCWLPLPYSPCLFDWAGFWDKPPPSPVPPLLHREMPT